MIQHYFEDEMRYLQEAGRAFAEVHPDLARTLNVDSLTDRDPHVERLFEGVAFLTARIRERLDDEFPQYTEGLLRLLHPHLVRPVPSCAILEFVPRPGMLQETTTFAPGLEVRSRPVGKESTACRFTTVYPVQLQPLSLTRAHLEWPDGASSSAVLEFTLDRDVEFDALDLTRLRLYFYADPSDASRMHLFFTRHVAGVTMQAGEYRLHRRGREGIRPVGFDKGEALLPTSPASYSGYRLLQEYFCFRPKFWFVDLCGFEAFAPPAGTRSFRVRVQFDRPYPEQRAFSEENLRLHCTPIINLFEADTEPVHVTHRAAEHRVLADARRPHTVAVYDVQRVVGTESSTGARHEYRPFLAFARDEESLRFFTETSRTGPSGLRETYVSIGGWGDTVERIAEETLTLEARCTNRNLPREALKERSIDQAAPGYRNVASFRNLTSPSRELLPPVDRHAALYWMLVSHLALNRTSVLSVEALTRTLRLYDWADTAANRRRIAGLRSVDWRPAELLDRGSVRRGAEVLLTVQDGHFTDDGDLNLFGAVLDRFLSGYATLNAFVHLTLTTNPSGQTLQWTSQNGSLPML